MPNEENHFRNFWDAVAEVAGAQAQRPIERRRERPQVQQFFDPFGQVNYQEAPKEEAPVKEEIPEEFKVNIDGVDYDKRSSNVKIDYLTGKYFITKNFNYSIINVVSHIRNGKINHKTEYCHIDNIDKLICARYQYNLLCPRDYYQYFFKSQEEIDLFNTVNNYVKGTNNTEVYYHKDYLQYDRVRPMYFDNIKRKWSVPMLIDHTGFKSMSRTTTEYKELQSQVFKYNEQLGMDSKTYLSFEGLQYTFGVELETVTGAVSPSEFEYLNASSTFDGSLRDRDQYGNQLPGDPWGAEYVTGVLKGDSGLNHLKKITDILSKKCTVDKRAAFHVHIGSLNWNSEDITYAYLLGMLIQDEMFTIMPETRTDNEYCKLLPKIYNRNYLEFKRDISNLNYKKHMTNLYSDIFSIVAGPDEDGELSYKTSRRHNKFTRHPKGRHGGYDRNADHRYSWLNFTNIIFNQRGNLDSKTIEFRVHSGTLCYYKIHNWIKFCMAFVEYVHNHKKDILFAVKNDTGIKIEDIIRKIYPKSGERLNSYFQNRKLVFENGTNNNSYDYELKPLDIKNLKDLICV